MSVREIKRSLPIIARHTYRQTTTRILLKGRKPAPHTHPVRRNSATSVKGGCVHQTSTVAASAADGARQTRGGMGGGLREAGGRRSEESETQQARRYARFVMVVDPAQRDVE